MSGQGRSGETGIRHEALGKLDFEGPDPVFVYHAQKRGPMNRSTGICSASGNTTTSPGLVTCEACKKLLAKRKGRAA